MYKPLWYQNYKQTRIVLWMILALYLIHMPFQAVLALESWKEREQTAQQADDYVYEVQAWDVLQIFNQGTLPILLFTAVIALACLLIGLERNTRRNDFTFSLPFSRKELFMAKWLYGAAAISVFHIVNFGIAYFIISQSEYYSALYLVNITEILWGPLFGFLLLFTFALFIGTITGELVSQIVLTFILAILPTGFFGLLQGLVEVHFRFYISMPVWIEYMTVTNYVFYQSGSWQNIVFPAIFSALLLWGSLQLYARNKIEHNGEFLIFKSLNPIFLTVITIFVSLLGGTIVSSLAPWNADLLRILAYWIGFVTFLLFALLIGNRLVTMNIMFKGKA